MGSTRVIDLAGKAEEILRIAESYGVEQNYLFITTFKRYQTQLMCLSKLERSLSDDGMLVTKEYVKGRKNLYANPALGEYARMSSAADRTVSTLIKVISSMARDEDDAGDDPLLAVLRGDG